MDIACPGADFIAPAHNLPFDNNAYDLVVSFDCMEHIPEEEVSGSISEFARVGNRAYVNISLADSPTLIDGEPLHVCVKSKEWWLDKFRESFEHVMMLNEMKPNTPHWKIVVYASHEPIDYLRGEHEPNSRK